MTDPKNLENWLHEKAGPAHDELKADPARAVSADRVRYTLDELLAEAEASGQYPLPPEQREWVDAPAVGREWPACEALEADQVRARLHDDAMAEAFRKDPAYDALKSDPGRAVTADRVRYTLDELLAEAEASGQYPLPPEQREWVDAPAVGREVLPPYKGT